MSKTYADYVDARQVALRKAKLDAKNTQDKLDAFVRRHGRPGTISGERLTDEQRAEYLRLQTDAEASYGSYAELLYGTQ